MSKMGMGAPVSIADGPLVTAGPNPRLRVDPGQTSFYDGREFRTFQRVTQTGGTFVVKIVVPINAILWSFDLSISAGDVLAETVSGGTEGGTFNIPLPILPANAQTDRPTPFYTSVITMNAGGTHTGGTLIDQIHVKADTNTNRSATVGAAAGDERGIAPGTYYWRFTITGDTDFVMHARWEERP